jgi:hypothetical protein
MSGGLQQGLSPKGAASVVVYFGTVLSVAYDQTFG